MTETVLVTGGTGFVGSWAVVALLKKGYRVRTTVRSLKKEAMLRAAIRQQVSADDRLEVAAADLTSDTGWAAAMAGVDRVLHVASPMHTADSADINTFLGPQRDGDMRVLKFAAAARVKHIVITSAAAAAKPKEGTALQVADETVWTKPNDPVQNPYQRSKALAEKAVWQWVKQYQGDMQVTAVLPTAVFGPVLMPQNLSSQELLQRMLKGQLPGVFNMRFDMVDVRDLAELEILAMNADAAANQRYLAVSERVSMKQIAQFYKTRMPELGRHVKTLTIPDWVLKLAARFNANVAVFVGLLGRQFRYTSKKAQAELGWQGREASATLRDSAQRMAELKLI